jgi:hypothetical protein
MKRGATALLAVALAAASGGVSSANVKVKPGVWEWRVTTTVSEVRTSFPEAGHIPADKRAEIEAAARRPVAAPPQVSTERRCVTPAMAREWADLTEPTGLHRAYGDCQRKILTQTAAAYKVSLVCLQGKVTGSVDYAAAPHGITGKTTMVRHESGYDRTDTTEVAASRVDAACPKTGDPGRPSGRSKPP